MEEQCPECQQEPMFRVPWGENDLGQFIDTERLRLYPMPHSWLWQHEVLTQAHMH